MGKAVYLDVGNRKVLATKITYNDLIILYKQYIEKYSSVPMLTQCSSKYNLPQAGIVKSVVKNEGISYNEFLLQFGKVRTLDVNGTHKNIRDLKYDDLVILYNQYINKFHEFPTANKCTYQYNLPSRQIILKILKDLRGDDGITSTYEIFAVIIETLNVDGFYDIAMSYLGYKNCDR